MRCRRFLTMGAVSLLGLVRADAQAPSQPAPRETPQTIFKTDVTYVDVDVVVTDGQGKAVSDLTVSDFELFEEGKPRKIETFSYIDIPMTVPTQFRGVERSAFIDVRSNREPVGGRMYVIVLDDVNISPLRTSDVKLQARAFIERHFGVGDVAAVAYTSGMADASQDFTGERHLLLASIDRFIGKRGQSMALETADRYYDDRLKAEQMGANPYDAQRQAVALQESRARSLSGTSVDQRDFARAQRALAVLDTLKRLADSLSTVRGRRKALLMFSEGIDYQMSDPFGMRSVSDVLNATKDAISTAARSNVNFYTIDPRGLVGAPTDFMQIRGPGMPDAATQVDILDEFKTSQNSLRTLAEETGGFAALDSNSFTSAFERIVQSNSRYYMLGYRAPDRSPDGQFHEIDVRVKRSGLNVTARRGYASPRARTVEDRKKDEVERLAREAKRPENNNTSVELRDVLDHPIQRSGLDMSVHAAAFRTTGKEVSVALAIEVDGERLLGALASNKLELSFFSINEHGRAGPGIRKDLNLALKPETRERVKAHGIRLNARIGLVPGRYQLRIGVREVAGGRTGSIFYDLIVPDFTKEKLAISGLLLTSVFAQKAPTAEPDPLGAKLLPGAATSRREFPVGDTLAIYTELYDNTASRQPREIDVLVRLISEQGNVVFTARDTVVSRSSKPSGISAQFVLKDLVPGPYLLRVEAQLRSEKNPVVRETLITVVP